MKTKMSPDAIATEAWPNRTHPGFYVIAVTCPHCSKQHTHGWGGPGDTGGHRASHCAATQGYNITIPEGFKVTR